jgi:prophage regulatory protein
MKRLIREAQCREMTGLSRTTRWELERRGRFPRRCRITEEDGRVVGWLESDLVSWVEARLAGRPWPTSDSDSPSAERPGTDAPVPAHAPAEACGATTQQPSR